MKLVNYKLQTQMESVKQEATHFLKEYLQNILEDTTKPYYKKADYVGLSLSELSNKIDTLSNDIKELQAYKKRLQTALTLAKELVADVLIQNGVDRVDGNLISSLTLQAESTSSKTDLIILDENKVMTLGYVKFSPDIEAIKIALQTSKGKKELEGLVSVITETTTIKPKVKVNSKKAINNTNNTQKPITLELVTNDDDTNLENVA